jgi:RNA polymerase sigma factor (sigma-70 family)
MSIFSRDPLANPEPLIRRVYAYVAYRIGDGADAEDVTSEVFERAVRYRDRYDARRGDPVAWLLGIARRCVSAHLGSRRLPDGEPAEPGVPGDLEADVLRRLELGAALAALEEGDCELLALRYGADLTARRIGQLLGMRTNAVEVALHRARGRLREALERGEEATHPEDHSDRKGLALPSGTPTRHRTDSGEAA